MRWWRRRRNLACRDAVALLTSYLDGALSGADRARLEEHLAGCPACREYLAQLRVTVDALGRARVEDVPEETVDELVSLYHRWRAGDA